MKTQTSIFILLMSLFPSIAFCQAGTLDPSFGQDGTVITPVGLHNAQSNSVALQPDGKIILSGYTINFPGYSIALVRYNEDGSLDQTFGDSGIVMINLQPDQYVYSEAMAMSLQPDGKILVTGTSWSSSSPYFFAAARFKNDGALDSSFADNGIYLRDDLLENVLPQAMALQPDGKFIAGGESVDTHHFAISRHTSNGAIDSAFGLDGTTVISIDSLAEEQITALVMQPDGKIVALGFSAWASPYFVFLRYKADGLLDSSFADNGTIYGMAGSGSAVVVQADGKVLGGGSVILGFGLTRYNGDGTVDYSFGVNGEVTTNLSGDAYLQSLALQQDGKIIAAGYSWTGSNYANTLVRYLQNGEVDSSFGNNGVVVTNSGDGSGIYSMAIQTDGRIVVAGDSYDFNLSQDRFTASRYLNDVGADVTEVSTPNGIGVFPNPFTESIQIQNQEAEDATLKIFDVNGKLVFHLSLGALQEISVGENLSPGIYLVELRTGEKISSCKIVKTQIQ